MCNSFNLVAATYDPLGIMVDPRASRANHSCKPNACMVYDGARVELRALERFEPGKEILLSYIDENGPFGVRQYQLKTKYRFTCTCSRCALGLDDPADALLPVSKKFMGRTQLPNFPSHNPQRMGRPRDPQHLLGDSRELAMLGALQSMAYDALNGQIEASHGMPAQEAMLDVLLQSGAWKLTRGPVPELLRVQMVAWLTMADFDSAFVAALKLYALVDPVLHPQSFHPVRVVHTWLLAQLTRFLATETESSVYKYCRAREINLPLASLPLVKEVYDNVTRSHGRQSGFGKMVGRAYNELIEHISAISPDVATVNVMAVETILPQLKALAEDKVFERAVDWIRRGEKAVERRNAAAAVIRV